MSFVGGEKVEKISPTPPGVDAWRIEGYVLLRRWNGQGQTVPYACNAIWRPDGRYLIDHLDLNGMGYGLAAVFP